MIQFYAPDIEVNNALGPEDSAHCARVLRKQPGDIIEVTDGKGHRFECRIMLCSPKKVEVEIISRQDIAKTWEGVIELWVAPTKNMDRMEWLVEKGVEIGVDRIVPMVCRRSERKVIKTERLLKIAVSAMKQSLKATLPEICEARSFKEMLADTFGGRTVMGYCSPEIERKSFASEYRRGENIRILIGPEGDFSPEEVEGALGSGVVPVTFGNERLRTETAALAAIHIPHVIQEISE